MPLISKAVLVESGQLYWLRRRWRRAIALALASCCAVVVLSGCLGISPPSDRALPMGPSRTVVDAIGPVEVPETPQRVVVLDTAPLDAALALGTKPIGSIVYGEGFPAYLGDRTDGIEVVGQGNAPNLEAILKLKPDLILGSTIGIKSIYKPLSRIAPVVLTEGSGRSGEWAENFRLYAEALGKTAEAEQLLAEHDRKIAAIRSRLGNPEDTTVSIIGILQGEPYFYTANSFSGSVLQDIGFSRPSAQARPRRWAARASREDLASLDGDTIFLVYSPSRDGVTSLDEFVRDPLWSKLGAVQQERVYEVRGEVWAVGRNIIAANQIADDVAQLLLETE
ncbi:ABC-type Fe3+-hydroxamate transport system, periplasmic component [Rubidibacter lacunae KORDI 51-2]|uniref:ABC-type Fe3+-hydroxamate transport system, periplasmic component n=1 Tax=Rubidibacter lacunae KORDI 51-2 TaxID=582515 RepID=U5DJ89_9CHRO|nr:iron-siderophore ABC transporter substrate-binding protein [Rubidibacter lacunae]ERN40997.1 ABC-type Fe3+-hydroxamate transport system, periplasmic component [Rubidibacter lacunae KORDI 51-2]